MNNTAISKWWLLAVFLPLFLFMYLQYAGSAQGTTTQGARPDGLGFTAELARTMSYGFLERGHRHLPQPAVQHQLQLTPSLHADPDLST